MAHTDWEVLLVEDAEAKAHALTLQQLHVPNRVYLTRSSDPAWFGYHCRAAAEAKYAAWLKYKRHPSSRNKAQHQEDCSYDSYM